VSEREMSKRIGDNIDSFLDDAGYAWAYSGCFNRIAESGSGDGSIRQSSSYSRILASSIAPISNKAVACSWQIIDISSL
jgi:hypothetical protein